MKNHQSSHPAANSTSNTDNAPINTVTGRNDDQPEVNKDDKYKDKSGEQLSKMHDLGLDKVDGSHRFQIRGSSAADAQILATFATREEADKALRQKQEERQKALSQAHAIPELPIIVDTGVKSATQMDKDKAREAAKPLEQKELEKQRAEEAKNNQPSGSALNDAGAPGTGTSNPEGAVASNVNTGFPNSPR